LAPQFALIAEHSNAALQSKEKTGASSELLQETA
jgi:hypothetical protein